MKIRNGFVSNSSSSSFIIIDSDPSKYIKIPFGTGKCTVNIPQTFHGKFDFDRDGPFTDFGTKVNFAFYMASQIDYLKYTNGIDDQEFYQLAQDYPNDPDWSFWARHKMSDFVKNGSVTDMVKRVVEKGLNNHNINWKLFLVPAFMDEDDYKVIDAITNNSKGYITEDTCFYASIDHQSNYYEKPTMLEIFTSDERLHDFLFNSGSGIYPHWEGDGSEEPMNLSTTQWTNKYTYEEEEDD